MLSFGIEYERAFSTAFWRARLAAGSPPPSRAATMIARASLEKSLPRFASAAPFLCLIDDHLLCPDMAQIVPAARRRSGSRQHPRDLVPLGPGDRTAVRVTHAVSRFDRADRRSPMPVLVEGRERFVDGLTRKDGQQGARGEGGPRVGADGPADGDPRLEPEHRLAVDADADARGARQLV